MRILLLAEVYPPEPIVGAFRIRKLAAAFADRGHHVTVVVERAGGVTTADAANIELHVSPAGDGPRERIARVARRLRKDRGQPSAPSDHVAITSQESNDKRSGLSGLVAGILNLPDDRQAVIPALLRGVRAAQNGRRFDVVYSSAPSFSVHLAAKRISRKLGIPWIIEFRDPWRTNGIERPVQLNPITDRIDRMLEKSCLTAATAVVAVTDKAGATFRSRLGNTKPVVVALNGIEDLRTTRVRRGKRSTTRIVYAGSLYPPRDPRPLLESIARVVMSGQANLPELTFVGHCHDYAGESLQQFANRIGIGAKFRMLEWLPQQEARELVSTADLVLLPAQQWVEQLPNKLFDYLGARVPILAIASPESETSRILQLVGGHFVCDPNADGATVDLVVAKALLAATSDEPVGDSSVLEALSVRSQFGSLVQDVENLFQPGSNQMAMAC